jgi:hypothetical protein
MSKAKVIKLLKAIPEYKGIGIKDRTPEKNFMKEFLEYAQKEFSGNFKAAAESIGESREKIKSIFDRVRLSETGTRKGADVGKGGIKQTIIPTPKNVIPYTEATTKVKTDKTFLKDKIKNFDGKKFYNAKDIANILGVDASNKKLLDRITSDLKRFDVTSKLTTGKQKEYNLKDAVNKITKGYEKKLVKGQRIAQTERTEIDKKLDPELNQFLSNFKNTTRSISKEENIFIPNAIEDVGHPLSVKITDKYPKLTKNSNINKINTLTFQDPRINREILEKTGYEAKHDSLLNSLNKLVGKKIGPKEIEQLESIKVEMNNLHNKALIDIKNVAKEIPYLKGQENRLPKIDISIPKAGQTFKSEDLFVDMSNVNPAFKIGLVDDINPKAKFFKDLTKEQKEIYKRNVLDQTKFNVDKFYTTAGFPKEQVDELKESLEFGTASKLGIGTVGVLGLGTVAAAAEEPIKYNDEIGAFVNPQTDDKVSQSTLLNWAADNPMPTAAVASAPLLSKTVRKGTGKLLSGLLSALGTSAAGLTFAGLTVKGNLDEGKNIVDATVDPMVGLELLYPEYVKKFGGKGLKNALGKALSFGRYGAMMTPVGYGITALGLGKMGIEAAMDEREKILGMTEEEKTNYLADQYESFGGVFGEGA